MKREDYMFCIGYQGNAALVDGQAKRNYAGSSIADLVEKGLFRFALSGALYDNDEKALEIIRDGYNRIAGTSLETAEDLKRLFGVTEPSAAIDKTILIK